MVYLWKKTAHFSPLTSQLCIHVFFLRFPPTWFSHLSDLQLSGCQGAWPLDQLASAVLKDSSPRVLRNQKGVWWQFRLTVCLSVRERENSYGEIISHALIMGGGGSTLLKTLFKLKILQFRFFPIFFAIQALKRSFGKTSKHFWTARTGYFTIRIKLLYVFDKSILIMVNLEAGM